MIEPRLRKNLPPLVGWRNISFQEDAVVKHQSPERTRVELLKTQLGAEIGRATGLFRTPAILAQDLHAGSITFERLVGYCNMRQALSTSLSPESLIRRVARTLAAIHARLDLPDRSMIRLPGLGVEPATRPVFVHGDFSIENILYAAERDDLVIMDWSVTDWLPDGTLGSRYIDLTLFVQSLVTRRVFGERPIPHLALLAHILLETYWRQCEPDVRPEEFDRCFRALISIYLETWGNRKGWRSFAYQPSLWRAQRLVRRFCRNVAKTR